MIRFLRKVRVALTPRSWRLRVQLDCGAVLYGQNRPGFGVRKIYIYREAYEPEFEHLEKFLIPGGVFLDVGGNTGAFTVKAAQFFRKQGGGTVVTVEPLPNMLAILQNNITANRFENVRLRSFCLGEQPGATDFWINFNRPDSASLVGRDPGATHISTLVFRLDDVFPLEKLDRLDYVKIDVEGAEAQVLAGARETFKKYRPIVQMEISIENSVLALTDYTEWHCPGGPNKVCIPNESPKNETVRQLGWQKLV